MSYELKNIILLFCFTIGNSSIVFAQELNEDETKAIQNFIDCVRLHKKEKLSDNVYFPLHRKYPIPPIENKVEFIKRYTEIFDDSLTKIIANSTPKNDWSEVGWRGIMLQDGKVWVDEFGKLETVNYQSKIEAQTRDSLINADKKSIYGAIRNYQTPICVFETKKYRVRIDDLGNENYRYSSWNIGSKMSDKPDIIIEKGEYVWEGTRGNHSYEFKNGEYTYTCSIIVLGEDNVPPAKLQITKGEKIILSQNAVSLQN